MSTVTNDRLVAEVQNSGLYYGFAVVVAATVGRIFTAPGQSACIGIAITAISESLTESEERITWEYLRGTLCSGIALWIIGPFIDKFGPRKCVVAIALGLAYGCYYLAQVQSMEDLLLALFVLRFFGQCSLMNLCIVQINYWWVKRRNVMLGFSGACVSLGMLVLVPGLMDYSIASVGWRQTYTIMTIMCAAFMAPWGLLWYRDCPEEYGVQPDGERDSSGLQKPESWTRCEALCTCSFWVFAFAQLSMALTYEAYWFHFNSIFDDTLLSDKMLFSMKTFIVGSMVVGQIASGFILDRVQARWVMVGALTMSAASFLLARKMDSFTVLSYKGRADVYLFIVASLHATLLSVSMSLSLTVFSVVYASYFGRKHLGAIQTAANSFAVFGCAVGPYMWGVRRDLDGDYRQAFMTGALLQVLCAFAVCCGGAPPLRKAQEKGYTAVGVDLDSSADDEESENDEGSLKTNEQ